MQGNSTRIIQRAYKTELDPSRTQAEALLNHAGACRFIYNLALERCQTQYRLSRASGRKARLPNAFSLNKELTELKQSECPWLYEVSNSALQNSLRGLDAAYANFFRRLKAGRKGRSAGYPKFKSKKRGVGSFKLNGPIHVHERSIQLPRIGTVRLKECGYLPISGIRITSATISERAGRWYVSIQVEESIATVSRCGPVVGVDVGISSLATTSDGEVIHNPRSLYRYERKLKRLQRHLSRTAKGGANRQKARRRVAKLHQRIANIRSDAIHKATTEIVNRYGVIVIEDLNVAGMMKNHCLAKALGDASMAEFHRQLAYKADWYGATIVTADRWYPSSKTCSGCGYIKTVLSLGDRVYRCESCGLSINRDVNAAINLKMVAVKSTETQNAFGASVRPVSDGQQALMEESALAWDLDVIQARLFA